MSPDFAQRRRVALAVAITAIAAPAAFLLDSGDDPQEVVTTVVGSVVQDDPGAAPIERVETPQGTDPMGTAPAAFLEPSGSVAPVDDPATIAIPRLPRRRRGPGDVQPIDHQRHLLPGPRSCGAPFGASITVTNLDNSRSVQCINNVGGAQPDDEIVLHADAFSQIGDLTDAPVPVALTW